jgi:hypothetical protein
MSDVDWARCSDVNCGRAVRAPVPSTCPNCGSPLRALTPREARSLAWYATQELADGRVKLLLVMVAIEACPLV